MFQKREFLEDQAKNEKLKQIGNHLRSLSDRDREITSRSMKDLGIDVSEAMHLTAKNRFDPHW